MGLMYPSSCAYKFTRDSGWAWHCRCEGMYSINIVLTVGVRNISFWTEVRRMDMSPYIGSRKNASYEGMASWVRAWFQTQDIGISRYPQRWPAYTSAMNHPPERMGTSWMVSRVGHNCKQIRAGGFNIEHLAHDNGVQIVFWLEETWEHVDIRLFVQITIFIVDTMA